MLLQNPDDLFFRKSIALHVLILVLGQGELQTGLSPRGKVSDFVACLGVDLGVLIAVAVFFGNEVRDIREVARHTQSEQSGSVRVISPPVFAP